MDEIVKPLVTVIIPFKNEERFLTEAIESVINQTYDHWELILIDDGSSDKSSHIATSYANKMPGKIFYYDHDNHMNKGVSASRNMGIDKSAGSLIAFLDADDVWLDKKLQLQVNLMNENPDVGMLCEPSDYWDYSSSEKANINNIKQLGVDRDKKFIPPQLADILYPLSYSQAPAPSGIMVRAEVAKKYRFEEHFTGKFQLYEDQTFLLKVYFQEIVYISSMCNHKYRQREDSCVSRSQHDGSYHEVRKFFLEWLEQYMKQHNFQSKSTKLLLKRALEPYRNPVLHLIKRYFISIARAIKKRLNLRWLLRLLQS